MLNGIINLRETMPSAKTSSIETVEFVFNDFQMTCHGSFVIYWNDISGAYFVM